MHSPKIQHHAEVVEVNGHRIAVLTQQMSDALPSRGQVAVVGKIDGHAFETVVEPDGYRGHWIKLDERLIRTLDIEPGHRLQVDISPAPTWPEPEIPGDLQSALENAPDIIELWESITPMARWEWVRWVRATKNPQTRARRVEVSISKMRSGKRRPCCFDLSACTDPDVAVSGKLRIPNRGR